MPERASGVKRNRIAESLAEMLRVGSDPIKIRKLLRCGHEDMVLPGIGKLLLQSNLRLVSIPGRILDMIDYDHIQRTLLGFQLEAKLFPHRLLEIWSGRYVIRGWLRGFATFGHPLQNEIYRAQHTRFIQQRTAQVRTLDSRSPR